MIHIITPVMDMVVAGQGNRKLEMETDFHSTWDRAIKLMSPVSTTNYLCCSLLEEPVAKITSCVSSGENTTREYNLMVVMICA